MWIYNFYKRPKSKVIYAFLISDAPMILVLSPYLAKYWHSLWNYPKERLFSLFLAVIWTWIGPYLILRWFDKLEKFLLMIDEIPGSNNVAEEAYDKKVLNSAYAKVIGIIWSAIVVAVLLLPSGRQNLKSYYLYGFKDPNYWIFITCVGYVALQTSIFILFMVYSGLIIKSIMENEAVIRTLLQNTGKKISIKLIGELVSTTASYFCSGFLFFPIMLVFFSETKDLEFNTSASVFILMGIFIVLILIYLGIMNWIVNDKVQAVKDKMIEELEDECCDLVKKASCTKNMIWLIYNKISEQELRQRIKKIAELDTNPIAAEQGIKIAYGVFMSGFLPAVFSVLLDMLKG